MDSPYRANSGVSVGACSVAHQESREAEEAPGQRRVVCYAWHKYGEKKRKKQQTVRSYYKCARYKDTSCPARKQVERGEGVTATVKYLGTHNHLSSGRGKAAPAPAQGASPPARDSRGGAGASMAMKHFAASPSASEGHAFEAPAWSLEPPGLETTPSLRSWDSALALGNLLLLALQEPPGDGAQLTQQCSTVSGMLHANPAPTQALPTMGSSLVPNLITQSLDLRPCSAEVEALDHHYALGLPGQAQEQAGTVPPGPWVMTPAPRDSNTLVESSEDAEPLLPEACGVDISDRPHKRAKFVAQNQLGGDSMEMQVNSGAQRAGSVSVEGHSKCLMQMEKDDQGTGTGSCAGDTSFTPPNKTPRDRTTTHRSLTKTPCTTQSIAAAHHNNLLAEVCPSLVITGACSSCAHEGKGFSSEKPCRMLDPAPSQVLEASPCPMYGASKWMWDPLAEVVALAGGTAPQ